MESKNEVAQINAAQDDTPSANREIKDGVFKLLFEKPENAAELYYALTGIKCHPSEIQIITLTNTISGKLKNDLAFVVRGKAMVVGEHQSTPNKNMPLRMLMYLGQLCEKWIRMEGEEDFLYRSGLYKIPTPEFAVFYNGITKKPAKEILKLSNAFMYEQDGELGRLELEVPVYNINAGIDNKIFDKSEKLRHYAEFIAKVREFEKTIDDYAEAVAKAVKYCIANGILVEFLKENGGKVVSILATYDVETAKRIYAEEQVEEERAEIARDMLVEGISVEKVARLARISLEAAMDLQKQIRYP